MSQDTDVLLVGFGAIGAIVAFVLDRSGKARVTIIARSNYEAVNTHGLDIQSPLFGHIRGWKPYRLCTSISQAADRAYSYVIIATKAIPELTRTSELLSPLLSPEYRSKYPQPTYVNMQNGLNVEVDLYKTLQTFDKEEPRIISTAVYIISNTRSQTLVEHCSDGPPSFTLGVYRPSITARPNTPSETALLEGFAGIFNAGGGKATIVSEIQRAKFVKNALNGVFGTTTALTRSPIAAFFRPADPKEPSDVTNTPFSAIVRGTSPSIDQYTVPVIYNAYGEIQALGNALFPPAAADSSSEALQDIPGFGMRIAAQVCSDAVSSTHHPSMMVDMTEGRPMEIEHIIGELVRMAHVHDVPVPRLEMLYALLLVVQNQVLMRLRDKQQAA